MITFDPYKAKSLTVPIRVKGIQQESLNFYFVIKENGVNYSFPANGIDGNEVSFEIPPLGEVIQNVEPGEYEAHIEVNAITENYKGFYMKPWSSTVKITVKPEVDVEEIEEDTKETTLDEESITVGEFKEKDRTNEEKPPEEPEPRKIKEGEQSETKKKKKGKNTKISKFLQG